MGCSCPMCWTRLRTPSTAVSQLGQHRSTQRKIPCGREDEEGLTVTAEGWVSYGVTGKPPARCQ
jgi:hypothetical protein